MRGEARLRAATERFLRDVGPTAPWAYAPPRADPSRDATPLLLGGTRAIRLLDGEELPLHDPENWTPEERRTVADVLARNALALQMLRDARDLPESHFGLRYASNEPAKFAWERSQGQAARLLALDARVALQESRWDAALDDIETLGRVARAFVQEPVDLMVWLALWAEQVQHETIGVAVALPSATTARLARCRASLPDTDLVGAVRRARAREMIVFRKELKESALGDPWMALQWKIAGPDMEADVLEGTLAGLAAAPGRPLPSGPVQAFRLVATGGLHETVNRLQVTLALRRLSSMALDLRQRALEAGAYPEEPFERAPLRYGRSADGSAVVELLGGREAWPEALRTDPLQRVLPAPGRR